MEKLNTSYKQYLEWQELNRAPVSDGYLFMESPLPIIAILIAYVLLVWIGPRIMKKRQAWVLKGYTNFYNLAQIIFCSVFGTLIYLATETEPEGIYLMCKRFNEDINDKTKLLTLYCFINFIVRIFELTETFVYILRKKDRQVSYLHVIHHIMNVCLGWISMKFTPGGTTMTTVMINIYIHLMMFTYYFASTKQNRICQIISKGLKKYITMVQIFQFWYFIFIFAQDLGLSDKCSTRLHIVTYICIAAIVIDLILFLNFYIQNYRKKPKSRFD